MRLYVSLFVGLVSVATTAHCGVISYETSIGFEDGLTDQLDRLNVGYFYERLSKVQGSGGRGFWDDCDGPDSDGISVSQCSFRPDSYTLEAGISGLGGWNTLGVNLTGNIADIQLDSLSSETKSEGRGGNSSSLSGSFEIGFSEEQIQEILDGNDQGIRLGYGFSWIGFGLFDDFEGVLGQWASLPVVGLDRSPSGIMVRSSFSTRITATSTDYSLQLADGPKLIVDETFTGAGEKSMTFPPDPASYGFTSGDIVGFRLDVEQRLWTERRAVKVPEPNSTGLLFAGILSLVAFRLFSKKRVSL